MQRQGLVSLVLLVVAASLLVFAISGAASVNRRLGATTNYDRFGSNGIGSIGWQVPPNTVVSTSHISNKPIWVQIDSNSQTHSYETLGVASYSSLSSVKPEAGIIAPYVLSVGFESNAV